MKKNWTKGIALLLTLIMALSLVGCGGSSTSAEDSAPADTEESADAEGELSFNNVNLVMGTASTTGTWYPIGGALCESMSKVDGINVTVQTSGGGVENVRTVASGERDIGMALFSLGVYAKEGKEAFEGQPLDNIRGISVQQPITAQFVVREDSGINCLADLQGKKVGIGAPGSGEEVTVREFLDANGMSYDDIDEQLISFTEQVEAFKNRQLDAIYIITTAPASGILDAAASLDVKLLPITGEEQANILEKYPFYYADKISAGAYDFLTEDVESVGMGTLLFTNAEADEDVIYAITKAMFDDVEHLRTVHPGLADLDAAFAAASMGEVELHPGAARYYKEAGLID